MGSVFFVFGRRITGPYRLSRGKGVWPSVDSGRLCVMDFRTEPAGFPKVCGLLGQRGGSGRITPALEN